MLQIKNTIPCPRCQSLLRVSARVVSDGSEYTYYLCPGCQDVVRQDPHSGLWALAGKRSPKIAEIARELQGLAVDDWQDKAARPATTTMVRLEPLLGRSPAGRR